MAALLNDSRGVGVGVFGVSAGLAVELGLGLAVGGRRVPTAGAFLRGEVGWYRKDKFAGTSGLVPCEEQDLAQGLVEKGPVETGLGTCAVRGEPAILGRSWSRAPDHVGQLEVLEDQNPSLSAIDQAA